MYSIDLGLMQPGDIVFTAEKSFISSAIRTFTGGDFSHVMLCVGYGSCIHADKKGGVHSFNVQRLVYERPEQILVKRYAQDLNREQLNAIEMFVRRKIGTQYSMWDAVKAAPFLKSKWFSALKIDFDKPSSLQFCSRLVAEAYGSAKIELAESSFSCAPVDIFTCGELKVVENAVIQIKKDGLEFARDKSKDKIHIQTVVTKSLLDQVRAIYGPEIQDLNDLERASVLIEGADEVIAQITASSGYLDLWRNDIKANPWRYSQQHFDAIELTLEQRKELISRELGMAQRELKRHLQNLYNCSESYKNHPTLTIKQRVDLYTVLVELAGVKLDLFTRNGEL